MIPREWPGPFSGRRGQKWRTSTCIRRESGSAASRPASAPVKTLVGHEDPPKMAGRELFSQPPPWTSISGNQTHLRNNTVSMAARREPASSLQQPTPTATAVFLFFSRTVRNQREQGEPERADECETTKKRNRTTETEENGEQVDLLRQPPKLVPT